MIFSYQPLYCRGDMINSLTETNIGRYLEFRAINKLFTRTGDKIEQVGVVYCLICAVGKERP